MRRTGTCLFAGAAALLLAACSGSSDGDPNFQPSPTAAGVEGSNGVHLQPIAPVPTLSGNGQGGSPGPGGSASASSSPAKRDPLVVATKLDAPVGLTMLPDNTALVGERTTGRIVRVQPRAGQPVPTVRTLSGIDPSGGGGLLDLALSPNYSEDNLIFAYITTRTDNRVVDFTLHGPVTPVLTGIPRGAADNTGRIAFAPDGSLYVGTGDADRPALAARGRSLAGKVLRITDIGRPAKGNPSPSSPLYTSGHRVVDGLCAVPQTKIVLEVESGADGGSDEVNLLKAGANYGWPDATARDQGPLAGLPSGLGNPGGCAVQGGLVWITSLDGKALLSAALKGNGSSPSLGKLTPVLRNKYGRLKTVVAAADGALWLTTANREGDGKPVAADERVIRYVPNATGGGGGVG